MSGNNNATRYDKQWIFYFDDDLKDTAQALANKKGNVTVSWSRYSGGNDSLPAQGLPGVVPNTRLIIVGHGDEKSTSIGNKNLTAATLAKCIGVWVGRTKIARISLHMCFGGGNRGTAKGSDAGNFEVHPSNSFAYKLASHCGQLANDITARTSSVGATFNASHDSTAKGYGHRKIEVNDVWRESGAGDKVFFKTNPTATVEKPINPSMQIRM